MKGSEVGFAKNIQTARFWWSTDSNHNAAANAWYTLTLNATQHNDIDGCSLSSNQITLGPGIYHVAVEKNFQRTSHTRVGFYSVTQAAIILQGVNTYHYTATSEGYGCCGCEGIIEVGSNEVWEARYYARSVGATGLGSNTSPPNPNTRCCVAIMRIG